MQPTRAGCLLAVLVTTLFLLLLQGGERPSRAFETCPHLVFGTVPALGVYQIQHVRTYVNLDPDLTRGFNLTASFEFEKAIVPLKVAAARASANPRLASEAETYLGYAYLNLRQSKEAHRHLQRAVALHPHNEMAWFYLASQYYLDGQMEEAKRQLLHAVAVDPRFVSALRLLAETYRDEGNSAETIRRYEQIVAILPNSGYYRYQLYRAYMDAGRWRKARQSLQALIAIEPGFALNYYRLGDIDVKLGALADARTAFDDLEKKGGPSLAHLAALGRARVTLADGKLQEACTLALAARRLRPDNQDVADFVRLVEEKLTEQRNHALRRILGGTGGLVLVILLAWTVYFAERRKHVISVISDFNARIDQIYEQEELSRFLLGFFSELMQRPQAMLMTFNRQSNLLISVESRGVETTSPAREGRIIVLTGKDVARWVNRAGRVGFPLEDLAGDEVFKDAFPSLVERLQVAGYEMLVPFREKNSFLGMMALGPSSRGKRERPPERDLMVPLITSAAQAMETLYLYQSSMIDETTGLFNKRYFKQQLGIELKRADRYQQPTSLLTLDLDDFKKVNDTYGHEQGDQVLRELGLILKQAVREGIDTAARTGGEEFLVLLPATSPDRACAVAERIRLGVEEHVFSGFSRPVRITVSVGVATYPLHASREQDLVEKADAAGHLAKKTGKNRVCVVEQLEPDSTSGAAGDRGGALTLDRRFEHLNITDEASGLFNFSFLSLKLQEEVRRADRYDFPCSLVLIGPLHAPLDEARRQTFLKQLAVVLKENLRDGIDVAARLEGLDVAVILPETPAERAAMMIERLSRVLSERLLPLLDDGPKGPEQKSAGSRICVGISAFPECSRSEGQLLETALAALGQCRDSLRPMEMAAAVVPL